MKASKKQAFTKIMGKGRLNLARGGVVRRKYADGGTIIPSNNQIPMNNSAPAGTELGGSAPGQVNTTAATQGDGAIQGISNFLGTGDKFQAGSAMINPGTNTAQLNNAYTNVNNALNAQVGIANQLNPQVPSAVQQQQMLANQYTAMTKGEGPNPAQAQLNQATGANVAAQAALMAGQRGAGANAGLIARQAAQQGAATQQNAVGQAATLQAQQQIAAQQNLANLSANQIGQAGTATTALSQAQQNEQNILQNANTAANNAAVSMQSNMNNVNAQTAQANQQQNTGILSGIGKMASNIPIIGGLFGYEGGMVESPENYADGGGVWGSKGYDPVLTSAGPEMAPTITLLENKNASKLGDIFAGRKKEPIANDVFSQDISSNYDAVPGAGGLTAGVFEGLANGGEVHSSHFHAYFKGGVAEGHKVPAVVSPKEVYLNPEQVKKVVHEGADPMKIGYHFPGKDKVKGKDSLKNDVIPADLDEGGVVIPVHITTHKMAPEKARAFVHKAISRKRVK